MSTKASPQSSSNSTSSAADVSMEAVNLAIRPLPTTRKGQNVLQDGQVELEVFVIDRLYLTSHDAWGHETTTSDVNRTLLCRFTGSPRNEDGNVVDWTQSSHVGNEVESMIKITNASVTSTCASDMLQLNFSAAVQDALAQRRSIAVPRKVVRWHRQLQARARIVTTNRSTAAAAGRDDESLNTTKKWYGALSKTKRMLQIAATTIFHEDAWFYSPSTTSSFTRQGGRHHPTSPSTTIIRARVFVEPPPCYAHEPRPPSYEDVTSDSSTS